MNFGFRVGLGLLAHLRDIEGVYVYIHIYIYRYIYLFT